jgi:hypothetical protein
VRRVVFPAMIVVAMGLTMGNGSSAAYLSRVGPSPIRFQAPPPPPSRLLAAIPLLPPAPETNVPAVAALPDPAVTNPAPNADTIVVSSPALPEPDAVDTNAVVQLPALPAAPAEATVITPQMLVPFFYQKDAEAKGKEAGVVGQLLFTPPRPGHAPSSKAVLKTE